MPKYMKTIQNSDSLPMNETIKKFLSKFKQQTQQDIIQQSYLAPTNILEAYFIVIFCYGGLQLAQKLQKILASEIGQTNFQEIFIKFKEILMQCTWKKTSNSTKTFQANSAIFCKNHKFLFQKIFKNISESTALRLYKQCCRQSPYLFGTRIRQLKKGQYIQRSDRRKNKRPNQAQQNLRIPGNNYLIICQSINFYIVGVFRTSQQYLTELTERQSGGSQTQQKNKKNNIRLPDKEIKFQGNKQQYPSTLDKQNNTTLYDWCCSIM